MKIVCKALCFIMLFIGLFLGMDRFFYDKSNTSPVWEIIQNPKSKELDILFIGSSHAYTAINPLIINEALGLHTAVLSSSAQPMDLAYADLKTLLHYKKPRVIVLEAYSVEGSAKDIYSQGKEGYLYNDLDGVRNPFYRACMVSEVLDWSRWLEGFSQLFRPMLTWKRLSNVINPPESYGNKKFGAILGFEPRSGINKEGVRKLVKMDVLEQANIAKLDLQPDEKTIVQDYNGFFPHFYKFIQLADQENIPVYIIKSPVARSGYVDLMKEIERVSRQYKIVKGVYNYNTQLTTIGLSIEDFFDSGHLNRVGSGKFTVFLTDRIGDRLNRKPDYSKVCYYKDESAEPLPNGLYRYRVETFPNSLLRFVIKDQKGKIIKKTLYGKQNYIDMRRIGYNNLLYFNIRPETQYPDTISPEERDFKFMKDQGLLQNYSKEYLEIEQQENEIRLFNRYQEVPVLYAFYVFRNGKRITQQAYSQNNKFKYKFSTPGKYEIRAEIKTKEKLYNFKSARIAPILFYGNELKLPKETF